MRRMTLALRVLGRSLTNRISRGASGLPSVLHYQPVQLLAQRFTPLAILSQDAEDDHLAALDRIRHADRGRFDHLRVADQDRFDLRRAQALAGHLDRVVRATQDIPQPVAVDRGEVAVHPDTRPARPVGFHVTSAGLSRSRASSRSRGLGSPARPPGLRTGRPSSSNTSAAMPGQGAEKAHGLSGRSGLPITIPPEISVPPE